MDKHSLESFVQVAEQQSFSRAAENLHITQPAISKRIANLESFLGQPLFDRIGKETQLTHIGKAFLPKAKQLLLDMESLQISILNLSNRVEGKLKLGVSHHIGLHRLPPALKEFHANYPDVELELKFVDSEKAHQMVASGELEIALATLSPIPEPNIHPQSIWPDPLTFVTSSSHALAQSPDNKPLDLSELAKHPAILPSDKTYTGQLITELFKNANINIDHSIETNYLETIRMMVTIGLGWAVLPRTMLTPSLKGITLNCPKIKRELGLISHQSRTLSNAANAFIGTIQKNVKNQYHQ